MDWIDDDYDNVVAANARLVQVVEEAAAAGLSLHCFFKVLSSSSFKCGHELISLFTCLKNYEDYYFCGGNNKHLSIRTRRER